MANTLPLPVWDDSLEYHDNIAKWREYMRAGNAIAVYVSYTHDDFTRLDPDASISIEWEPHRKVMLVSDIRCEPYMPRYEFRGVIEDKVVPEFTVHKSNIPRFLHDLAYHLSYRKDSRRPLRPIPKELLKYAEELRLALKAQDKERMLQVDQLSWKERIQLADELARNQIQTLKVERKRPRIKNRNTITTYLDK